MIKHKNPFMHFGPGYKYDDEKTEEENWKDMGQYYAQLGCELGDSIPEDDKQLQNLVEEMWPGLEKMIHHKGGDT